MRMKVIITVFVVLALYTYQFPFQKVPLPELENPLMIQVEGDRLYVVEGAEVFIYRLADMTLQKRFGGIGDKPWEFNASPVSALPISIDALPEKIMVESYGRITVFSRDGEFIENHRPGRFFSGMVPLGASLVALRYTRKNGRWYRVLDLYNAGFEPVAEVYRNKTPGHWRKRRDPLSGIFIYGAINGKIFLAVENDFIIYIYDADGKKERTITREYQPVRVPRRYIDAWFELQKERHGEGSGTFKRQKKIIRFPDYFPAIRGIFPDCDRLYVETWKQENSRTQCIVLKPSGETIDTIYLPSARKNEIANYPRIIHNGTYYRLLPVSVKGTDKQSWTLFIDRVGE